jgi:hypothetical protein
MNYLGPQELIVLSVLLLTSFVVLVVPTAYQAFRRGYNPVVWGLVGLFTLNPIFPLVILAMVPHRSRIRLREQFTRDLDAKLASVPGARFGEVADNATPVRTHSLGDLATELPPGRSLGDDPTRL